MFADPKKVKDIKRTIRLNDYQDEKLDYVANAISVHPSALLRKLAMMKIDELYEQLLEAEERHIERLVQSSTCAVEALVKPVNQPMKLIMQAQAA